MTQFSSADENRLSLLPRSFGKHVPVTLTVDTWHAAAAGGAPLAVVAGFVDPVVTSVSRIPRIVCAVGGATAIHTLVGTYNGAAKTVSRSCTTNATTDFADDEAFDTITSWTTDIDPVSNSTLQAADSYFDPAPCGLHVSGAGNINCELANESALQVVSTVATGDWPRRVRRVSPTSTTATGLLALYP